MDTSKNAQRTRGKPFAPGNKLGKGRPHGSRNAATILLQAILDGEGEALTRTAIELAKDGDQMALRLCLERLIAPRRDRPVNLKLPAITSAAGVAEATNHILQELAAGNITPSEAATIGGLLEVRRRTIETTDLEIRIAALEITKES